VKKLTARLPDHRVAAIANTTSVFGCAFRASNLSFGWIKYEFCIDPDVWMCVGNMILNLGLKS